MCTFWHIIGPETWDCTVKNVEKHAISIRKLDDVRELSNIGMSNYSIFLSYCSMRYDKVLVDPDGLNLTFVWTNPKLNNRPTFASVD